MNFYAFLLGACDSTRWKTYLDYLAWVQHAEVAPAARAVLYMIQEWQSPEILKRERKCPWFARMARRLSKKIIAPFQQMRLSHKSA